VVVIQDMSELNHYAGLGVEVVVAKPEGTTLSGVAEHAGNYVVGLPPNIQHVTLLLPWLSGTSASRNFVMICFAENIFRFATISASI